MAFFIRFVFIFVLVGNANAASFDCAGSRLTEIERTICGNPEISLLDEKLADSFSTALKRSTDPSTFRSTQRNWLRIRDNCVSVECLKVSYQQRIEQLLDRGPRNIGTPARTQSDVPPPSSVTSQRRSAPTTGTQQMSQRDVATRKITQDEHDAPTDTSGYGQIGLLIYALIVLIGIIMGWREKAVIFRDFNDLALVFGVGACMVGAFFVAFFTLNPDSGQIAWGGIAGLALIVALALLVWVIVRTFQDNTSIITVFIALITKLTLSVIFLINLVSLIRPAGRTQADRSKNRAGALVILMVLTPLVYRLVRNKTGIWMPSDMMNSYQRSKLGI